MKTQTTVLRWLTIRLLMGVAALISANSLQAALVARLTFDDPANLNADSSGNTNHATVVGSPSATTGITGGGYPLNANFYQGFRCVRSN